MNQCGPVLLLVEPKLSTLSLNPKERTPDSTSRFNAKEHCMLCCRANSATSGTCAARVYR